VKGQVLENSYGVSATPDVGEAALLLGHRFRPGGSNAGGAAVPRPRTKREARSPLGENPPLFVLAAMYDSGGLSASRLTVGDLNGDGNPDLVVANEYPGDAVHVLLGNGDGTFQAPVEYSPGPLVSNPWSVAIGDVNGDDHPDLIVGNFSEYVDDHWGSVGVLLGNGDGTFQPVVNYKPGGCGTFSVAIGDVNNDGKPDIVTANWYAALASCGGHYGMVGVLLGNGDGTFQAPVSYSSGGYEAYSVAMADVNSDEKPDLLVANNCQSLENCSSGSVSVLLGNGDGTFNAAVSYSGGGSGTASVTVADVNGDGHLDLVTANCGNGVNGCKNGMVGVLLGNGDGTFQTAISYPSGGAKAFSVAIGDVNGDGHPDLAVANTDSSSVGVLRGNGDGTFQPAVTFDSGGVSDFSVAMADVNRDAHPDLLVANVCAQPCDGGNGEGAVGVLLNNLLGLNISTVTTRTSSRNPSVFGQTVTFTAKVSSTQGTPTGVVTFFDGSTTIGTTTLVNGATSLSVSLLTAGSHSITAKYQGSLVFSPSTSSPINQIVNTATTITSLVSSPNPVGIYRTVAYTATVTSQYGGAVTGKVTFRDGGSAIATITMVNNRAAYSTSYKSIGVHSITASYSGDGNNNGSTSAALTEYVASISKTVVVTSGSPTYFGQPVTFSATVTSTYGTIPDGELVTFYDGTKTMASVALVGGKAAYTTSALSAKTHAIKATYVGDTKFLPSTGGVTQAVIKYATTTTLTSSPNPSNYGQLVTFTATVPSAGPMPTGKVWFKDGTIGIGTVVLSGGVARLMKSSLARGTHSITAQYLGDNANAKSTSAVLNQVVQ
jgi:Big-like domain-containing protein/VCBS repeat protein